MKRMLVVGGGYADIPLILSAKKLGFYVITTGNRPEELGHKYSDEYHQVDFSDCDAIYELARKLKVSAICPSCNDFAALSASYAAEMLELPGHDSFNIAKIIHHKDEYRKFAATNGIPSPKARGFMDRDEALESIYSMSLPLIIKPVDLTGGKGITTIYNYDEAQDAINKAFTRSKNKRIVIEEYIEGNRHGFSAFLYKGKVKFYFSDNEHYYLNPYMVSAASSPSLVSEDVEKKLCMETEKIASLLPLKDGIFHIQYILKDDKPIIIEICRRPPGDLYINLVKYATEVDYPKWIVQAFSGIDCGELEHVSTRGYFTRHCIMTSKVGKIKDIIFDQSIKNNIIDQFLWWQKGDEVSDIMTAKFGIVFLKFDTFEEMMSITKQLNELIKVEMER